MGTTRPPPHTHYPALTPTHTPLTPHPALTPTHTPLTPHPALTPPHPYQPLPPPATPYPQGSTAAADLKAAIDWLATMHALYWGDARADAAVASGLNPQGTYWYLDTRPDEYDKMPTDGWEGRLKLAAKAIDERLKADPHQTIVHGDAKNANMYFNPGAGGDETPRVSVYDFQYCGKANPMKDLAYLVTCSASKEMDVGDAVL